MTVQSAVGGTAVAGTMITIGSAQIGSAEIVRDDPAALPVEVARGAVGELARTGASATLTLLVLAVLLILAGLLVVGIARRHRAVARGASGRQRDSSPTAAW
jgi:LPXTG-motif cell wall-anchored protein